MAKLLYCSMCKTEKSENDFTPFPKNPALKDRRGRVHICRECANSFVNERGNTKEALKEILMQVNIPFLNKFAQYAEKIYKNKVKGTNVVTRKNVYDGTETTRLESNKLQTTIYTCYTSKLGVMPKGYINYSFSDGIRGNEPEVKEEEVISEDTQKDINWATNHLKRLFGEKLLNDKPKLAKAIKLRVDEASLHQNDTTQRQNKFKLRKAVNILVDAGMFNKKDFLILFDGEDIDSGEEETIKEIKKPKVEIPEGVDIDKIRLKWGLDYSPTDCILFENKYNELKRNYELKTSSHEEFLKHACISSVKANQAMAKSDIEIAEKWMKIFKDVTSAGKLQPQQMSKADLSGGLNNFSEFYRSVEQAKGVVEILPEFKKQPKDDADFVLYAMVQYVRRLKGLPDIKYEDIWEFYDELAKAFHEDNDYDIREFIDNSNEDEDYEGGDENAT